MSSNHRLALSAFRDQCPPLSITKTIHEINSGGGNNMALMASSKTSFESTIGDIASASSMQMASRNALSANRGKRTIYDTTICSILQSISNPVAPGTASSAAFASSSSSQTQTQGWTRQVKWLKTGEMKIVRKRRKIETSSVVGSESSGAGSGSIILPLEYCDETNESPLQPQQPQQDSIGWFPCMYDWKRNTSVLVWKECMEHFHDGFFRRSAAMLCICFLRYGKFIVQRWLLHNVDSNSARSSIQLQTMQTLYQWTLRSIMYGRFPILYQFLHTLSIDVCINTALAWLRADLEDVCLESGYHTGGATEVQDWMEMFVLRIMPWFVRLFFFYPAPTTKCPITHKYASDLFPHLELTWVKRSCVDAENLWNTMFVHHSKSVRTQTTSIPLLGVRQQEKLHREEEMVAAAAAAAAAAAVGAATTVATGSIFFHTHIVLPYRESSVQTRSQARSLSSLQEDKKKLQSIWMHNVAATKQVLFWIPRFQSTLLLFAQLTKYGGAGGTPSSSSSPLLTWLDPLRWSLPSSGKWYLQAFNATKCFSKWQTKQLLCHAESEIQWSSFLEDIQVEAETTPWMVYTLSDAYASVTSTRIRAIYCFCNQHALPLLKRMTLFSPISGYRIGVTTDAYGIDVLFLDDCGSSSSSSMEECKKRACVLRFFDTCHVAQTTNEAINYMSKHTTIQQFANPCWELDVSPVYHSCCVFKDDCQATIFDMKAIGIQFPNRHLLFESVVQSQFEYRKQIGKWCRKKK